jgi:hypothetical protein
MLLNRFFSAIRYLSFTDSIWAWKFGTGKCPNCGVSLFISLKKADSYSVLDGPFMCRCLRCKSNIINSSLIPVITQHLQSNALQPETLVAWEMSTYGATLQFLKGNFSKTYESEYFPGVPSGEMVDGVLSQDCTKTSFGDASLDLVTSNQVLEHVPNFQAALTEVLRVLRPGGAFIFSVPLYNDKTRQIAKLDLTQKVVFFGKPEFHDSRIGGPKSAPVFWRHGTQDIIEIIETSGFETELVDIWVTDVQRQPMSVIYARKPSKIGSM